MMLWIVAHQTPLSMGFFSKNTGVGSHSHLHMIFLTWDQTWISCITGRFFTLWTTMDGFTKVTFIITRSMLKSCSSVTQWAYKEEVCKEGKGWKIDLILAAIIYYGNCDRLYFVFYFLAPKSLQMVTEAMKLKDTCSLEEKLWPT